MKIKKLLLVLLLTVTLGGCTIEKQEYTTFDDTIKKVISRDTLVANVSLEGYHYYLPKGVRLQEKHDTNSILRLNNKNMYLYVDIVSYYHKVENTFKVNKDVYYSKEINLKDKWGYIEITAFDDLYFVELMYNYAKIESFIEKHELYDSIYQMALILSSIDYNDAILSSLIGNNALNYTSEIYDILTPKQDKETDYLDYEQIYEEYEGEIKDEDSIEITEDEER